MILIKKLRKKKAKNPTNGYNKIDHWERDGYDSGTWSGGGYGGGGGGGGFGGVGGGGIGGCGGAWRNLEERDLNIKTKFLNKFYDKSDNYDNYYKKIKDGIYAKNYIGFENYVGKYS